MPAPQLPQGHVVAGKYSIQAPIGGTSGPTITYSAVTAQGRQVALKMFDMAIRQHAEAMGTIERIYQVLGSLPPDGIVPVIDAGYDPVTGAPYSVTEVASCPSLAQATAQGALPAEAVGSLLRSMGQTLDAAHGMQLFHHALRPTNVFVAGQPPALTARVMDFGAELVRRTLPTPEAQAQSAPWLAPEQVQGAPAGAAADVFSAALVAFFAMTGRSFWRACAGPQPDLAAWQQELMAPRTPPSLRALELGVSVPGTIDKVMMRALSPDPNERPRSVGEFAQALAQAIVSRDTAATAALPASAFLPPPGAEMHAAAGPPATPDQGWSAPPPPMQGPPGAMMGPPGMTPPPGGVMNAAPAAAYPPEQRSSSKLVPILIGVAALLLVVGSVAAWFLLSGKETTETGPIAVTPVVTAPPETPEPAAEEDAGPPPVTDADVTLSCKPACDGITVDGQAFSSPGKLTAGTHQVVATKAGYDASNDTLEVVAGTPVTKEYALVKTPVAPAGNPKPAGTPTIPKEKCGKFLKRCKD